MAPILFYTDASPVARSTLLVIKALNIQVELSHVNLLKGEHMTPEYLKMNPQHTVPTLKDGDFVVWDSHAINIYLIEKYAPQSELYPSDPQTKATVNQRLFFDTGIFFPRSQAAFVHILQHGVRSKDKSAEVTNGYRFLESFLEGSTYAAGETLTIADLALITSITTSNVVVPLPENTFPKIAAWMSTIQKLPYYTEANQPGLDLFAAVVKSKLK